MNRLQAVLSSHMACELERDKCAHAMAEERERFVEVWCESLACDPYQLVHFGEGRLLDAQASSGQLNWADLDRIGEILLPKTEDRSSTAGVRETEEAHISASIRLLADQPRRFRSHEQVRSIMKLISNFGPDLARLDPMSPSQQRTVIEQVAAVRYIQYVDCHGPVLAESLPHSQIKSDVTGQVCRLRLFSPI